MSKLRTCQHDDHLNDEDGSFHRTAVFDLDSVLDVIKSIIPPDIDNAMDTDDA